MTIAERLERKGRREGRQEGRRQGRVGDKREVLERHLDRKFGLTEEERKLIRAEADPKKLDAALDAVLFADTRRAVLGHLRSTDRSKARR